MAHRIPEHTEERYLLNTIHTCNHVFQAFQAMPVNCEVHGYSYVVERNLTTVYVYCVVMRTTFCKPFVSFLGALQIEQTSLSTAFL